MKAVSLGFDPQISNLTPAPAPALATSVRLFVNRKSFARSRMLAARDLGFRIELRLQLVVAPPQASGWHCFAIRMLEQAGTGWRGRQSNGLGWGWMGGH